MGKISCSFKCHELRSIKRSLLQSITDAEKIIKEFESILDENNPSEEINQVIKVLKISVNQDRTTIDYINKKLKAVKGGVHRS